MIHDKTICEICEKNRANPQSDSLIHPCLRCGDDDLESFDEEDNPIKAPTYCHSCSDFLFGRQ